MILEGNIYFLQYGIYTKENVMNDVIKKLDNYFVIQEDNKYYVYLGAYITYSNALKMQKIFEDENIYTYIKNDYLNNGLEDEIKKLDNEFKEEENKQNIKDINNKIINLFKN